MTALECARQQWRVTRGQGAHGMARTRVGKVLGLALSGRGKRRERDWEAGGAVGTKNRGRESRNEKERRKKENEKEMPRNGPGKFKLQNLNLEFGDEF